MNLPDVKNCCEGCLYFQECEDERMVFECEIHPEWNPIYEDDEACEDFVDRLNL